MGTSLLVVNLRDVFHTHTCMHTNALVDLLVDNIWYDDMHMQLKMACSHSREFKSSIFSLVYSRLQDGGVG